MHKTLSKGRGLMQPRSSPPPPRSCMQQVEGQCAAIAFCSLQGCRHRALKSELRCHHVVANCTWGGRTLCLRWPPRGEGLCFHEFVSAAWPQRAESSHVPFPPKVIAEDFSSLSGHCTCEGGRRGIGAAADLQLVPLIFCSPLEGDHRGFQFTHLEHMHLPSERLGC